MRHFSSFTVLRPSNRLLLLSFLLLLCGAGCYSPQETEIKACVNYRCKHGNWGSWGAWSSCSRSCREGVRRRVRRCDQPAPAFGGNPCLGPTAETMACVVALYCEKAVNGQWGEWQAWTVCSNRCSVGTRVRVRTCNKPKPKFGGEKCPGKMFEDKSCIEVCSVHGGWSAWKPITPCRGDSGQCSKGWHHLQRTCDNPAPKHGGRKCIGEKVKAKPCWDLRGCPEGLQPPADFLTQSFENKTVLVSWRQVPYGVVPTNFEISSKLASAGDASAKTVMVSAEASKAEQPTDGWRYSRMMDFSDISGSVMLWIASLRNPKDNEIQRALSEKHTIIIGEVDGSWSAWDPWSECSKTCGTGRQTRIRHCDSPTRTPNGRPCPGKDEDSTLCDRGFC